MNIQNYDTSYDKLLIESVFPPKFISEHNDIISAWLSAKSTEEIQKHSVEFHRILVNLYLDGKLLKSTLDKKYEYWIAFEQNIDHVESTMGHKFYRDHIAHILRTI